MPAETPRSAEPFRCPICRRPVPDPPDPPPAKMLFPFCSDRCKLIDLGRWIDGSYQVPVQFTPDPDEGR